MAREMKDSGVEWIGEIPSDWMVQKIKTNFIIIAGATPKAEKQEYWDGDILWITPADYKTVDKYVAGGRRNISEMGYQSCGTTLVPANSVIFSKRAPIGSVAINTNPLCTNQGCLSCVNKGNGDSRFFYYAMSIFTDEFELMGSGTTFKEISANNFSNFQLACPHLTVQQRIADFLDAECSEIDSVLEKTRDSIDEYKKLKQAVITQAVTKGIRPSRQMKNSGSVWFGDVPTEWDMNKLKYQFHIKKDIAGEEGHTILSITQRGIVPKDTSKNEGQLAESYSKYQLVEPGDFAMNHMDLLTGWVDISKYNGVTSPDYRVFVLNDTVSNSSHYYLYMMQMCYSNRIFYGLGQGVSGLGRWRLQADKFLNFVIAVPPTEEQIEIADYLDKKCAEIDILISKKQQFLTELETYKKSLIYEYVTGKKEVR